MQLTAIILFAVATAALEFKLYKEFSLVRQGVRKVKGFGVVFSFLLSYLVGLAFGAHGTMVLMAGILSTVMTQPVYTFINWVANRREAREHKQRIINATPATA